MSYLRVSPKGLESPKGLGTTIHTLCAVFLLSWWVPRLSAPSHERRERPKCAQASVDGESLRERKDLCPWDLMLLKKENVAFDPMDTLVSLSLGLTGSPQLTAGT